ncbi:MAG: hypothetical protein M1820_008441 [Bogoriella megaspora]|nr:MAG: hypothetical protein M1820_008441 [Bogoriella megaspora]
MVLYGGSARRLLLTSILVVSFFTIYFIVHFRNHTEGIRYPLSDISSFPAQQSEVQDSTLTGHAIAPKLGNETAKAELGRAAWKVLHTMVARFPEKPSSDEKNALHSYILLFARLYPCGECAHHFQEILNKFPPQVSSRNVAAGWACHVHNEVNKSLDKEIFDCAKIGDFYDCGCADDKEAGSGSAGAASSDDLAGKSTNSQSTSSSTEKNGAALPRLEKEEYVPGRHFDK